MATVFKLKEKVVLLLVVLGFAAITTTTAQCFRSSLPSVPHADLDYNELTDSAVYKCSTGYRGRYKVWTLSCTNNNMWVWDGTAPICKIIKCRRPPPDIDHATYTSSDTTFSFRAKVDYTCDEGYEQVKGILSSVVCQANEKWTVMDFKCGRVTCPALSNPVGGTVRIMQGGNEDYQYGDKYEFECNKGVASKGRQKVDVVCLANGKWSEDNITCVKQRTCLFPTTIPPIENGELVVEGLDLGSKAYYRCENWAIVEGGSRTAWHCQQDGTWEANNTDYNTCVPKEPTCDSRAPKFYHAWPLKHKYKYGDGEKVSYGCHPDYAGNATATCVGGHWVKEGECKNNSCRRLPHSDMTGPLRSDESRTITCHIGYTANGSTADVKCVDGKLLSKNLEEFKCSKVKCDEPPTIAHATYDNTLPDQVWGSRLTYVCDNGYAANGVKHVVVECLETGKWSAVKCEPADCEAPLTPDNSKLTYDGGDKMVAGSTRVYRCDAGTAVEGSGGTSITIECQAGGTWTHAGAKCVSTEITTSTSSNGAWAPSDEKRTAPAATCEAPLTPGNSKLTDDGGDKLVAGSTRVYRCDAGTAVEGYGGTSITLECQAGGTWTWTSI